VIAWGYSQKYLPVFLPLAFLRAVYYLSSGKIDLIHVGDGLLSPLGFLLKKVSGRPVAVNLHGLDMTYPNHFYQLMIQTFLPRLDHFICISRNTKEIAVRMGIPEEKVCVIPCGIQIEDRKPLEDKASAKRQIELLTRRDIDGKKVVVTVGRLVRRKGVRHFIGEILPLVVERFPNVIYLVVGEGEDGENIRNQIERENLKDHVIMLGRVGSEELKVLYDASDLFAMPNIRVEGDVEGFGIVALEASLAGLPVVAFAVEGIRDAISDGANGALLEPGDDAGFAERVIDLLNDDRKRNELGNNGREFTRKEYSWENIARRYREYFDTCTIGNGIRDKTVREDGGW
jgi:phosphatidylinositol alpha-1,6-mannosyltransferase